MINTTLSLHARNWQQENIVVTFLLKGKMKLTFKIHELTNPLLTNVIISKYLHTK